MPGIDFDPEILQEFLTESGAEAVEPDDATLQAKARAPLREGRVEVREKPGKPGSYYCVMHLRPHFQLDQVVTAVRLVTEITPGE